MKRLPSLRGGYTIVETLIYLAVTGSLFVSAAVLISGQQNKTEFSQAVREVESYIIDISNDISTGYYPSTNVGCTFGPAGPVLGGSRDLGTNGDCLFLGRLFHVAPAGTNGEQTLNVYTVFGNRLTGPAPNSSESKTLAESNATIHQDILDTKKFSEIFSFKKLTYGGAFVQSGAFGFVSSLGSFTATGDLNSGSTTASTVVVGSTTTGMLSSDMENNFTANLVENPGKIELCLESNATNAHAIITVGAQDSPSGIRSIISTGDCI